MQQPQHRPFDRAHRLSVKLVRFGRDFLGGLTRHDLERMFDEDAVRAFTVLAGEEAEAPPPSQSSVGENLLRFLRQVKAFFLGLAFKLSPARRVLFTVSLLVPVLGALDFEHQFGATAVSIDFEPFWFLLSIAGLTLLVALELADRLRVRDELDVARELQRGLLPLDAPRFPGWEIAHAYRTANEIGGDYYDFLPVGDRRHAVVVGDASGHGIGAGLLMAIANATLKTALDLDPHPEAVLELANRTLYRTGSRRAFMTLFYALLDPATGELEYACAGHPFPLLRRASGEVLELGRGALPLGIGGDTRYACERLRLELGDLLVLFSDGLPEAMDDDDEAFGFERLRDLVASPGDAAAVHRRILDAVDSHLGGRRLGDDLTLVVLYRRESPELPPLPPPAAPPPAAPPPAD